MYDCAERTDLQVYCHDEVLALELILQFEVIKVLLHFAFGTKSLHTISTANTRTPASSVKYRHKNPKKHPHTNTYDTPTHTHTNSYTHSKSYTKKQKEQRRSFKTGKLETGKGAKSRHEIWHFTFLYTNNMLITCQQ